MKDLTYKTLKEAGYHGYLLEDGKEKVIQFGEGNFLRGFVDDFIDIMNEKSGFDAKVAVVQPIPEGRACMLNNQEGLYTLYLRGREGNEIKDERRIISCISRGIDPYTEFDSFLDLAANDDIEFIISNTTEAGIIYDETCSLQDEPPASFPAKLTRLLYERFMRSSGGKGYIILSCELIDDNGKYLKDAVLKHSKDWELGSEFREWIHEENIFCSTLVDRIVTGYPSESAEKLHRENGYKDDFLDTAEYFGLWVIEGPDDIGRRIPFDKAGLPVIVTDDHKPYKIRKVRILNGAHTSMVPVALLYGETIVRDSMQNEDIGRFVRDLITEEVIPTIPLCGDQLNNFARDVFDRFENPFIDHKLEDISLNSISKWTARVKPALKDFVFEYDILPVHIVFSFAALIAFYKKGNIRDSKEVIEFFEKAGKYDDNKELLEDFMGNEKFFGEDLREIKSFGELTQQYLDQIEQMGMKEALRLFLKEQNNGMD
ncbi:tagaturonate reductase [Mogibacterium sp. NSJ-24]|jgi:tagaturonate reductase|uniref:Tagaturonate reductase n=1 Tax=Lentihominibacter hominis TaxID=2763645 RepID=A0A926E4U1_9FIRM|nr:tagaturonate reductase [Lentihominibacter hominis]MBC8567208.1 tagaturonate reductase [Lentihominibacter hominis]